MRPAIVLAAGFIFGLWFCPAAFAADTATIYHDGWIDLNKNRKQDIYEDSSRPVTRRVSDLLKRMTLAEKIGQLAMPRAKMEAILKRWMESQVNNYFGFDAGVELLSNLAKLKPL